MSDGSIIRRSQTPETSAPAAVLEPLLRHELGQALAKLGSPAGDRSVVSADAAAVAERRQRFWSDVFAPVPPSARPADDAVATGSPAQLYLDGQADLLAQLLRTVLVDAQPRGFFSRGRALSDEIVNGIAALARATLLDAALTAVEFTRPEPQAEQEDLRNAPSEFYAAVAALEDGLHEIADGDLTARLPQEDGPLVQIAAGINGTISKLQTALRAVAFTTQSIYSGIDAISDSAQDLSSRTGEQAVAVERTASAVGQITEAVRRTADAAEHARAFVSEAKNRAERSGNVVQDAISTMADIKASVTEMSDIIVVIDEIALQTNLLALNAGVEAARAGESGRGFAVIANEVRSLAQRSAEAAKRIKHLIQSSTDQVAAGVSLVGETGSALSEIVGQVTEINQVVTSIAESAHEQASGLTQINQAVAESDAVIRQNAAMAQDSTGTIQCLKLEAGELARLIGELRLGDLTAPGERSQRKDQRFQRRERVQIAAAGRKQEVTMLDCSSGGARFEGRAPGPLGMKIELVLDGRAVPARLVRADAGGFAISFANGEARGIASEYILSGRKRARLAAG